MDAQDSPDRERGRRQWQDDGALPSDSDDSEARHYNWVQICLISAMGLAVGVMGTAAYVIWFSGDQQAYAEAVQVARRPPSATLAAAPATELGVPQHAAVPTSSVTGRVIPASPAQKPAQPDTRVLASAQPPDDDAADVADASDDPQQAGHPAPAAAPNQAAQAARADHGKQAGSANRHAQRAKPKETFMARLTAMFRKVGYHRGRDPGNHPDPYSHP